MRVSNELTKKNHRLGTAEKLGLVGSLTTTSIIAGMAIAGLFGFKRRKS